MSETPALILKRARHYEALIRRTAHHDTPIPCAVAHPCERTALEGPGNGRVLVIDGGGSI